jgi:TatD DNase family protein
VGEIGLDRLKSKTISEAQRAAFAAQLQVAAEFRRPVQLHGAKCWGEVVKACRPFAGQIPAFVFHGFSRSDGLLPEIYSLNGFVSIGPAILNDHAVNYREMVKKVPLERLLVESDAVGGTDGRSDLPPVPRVAEIAAKLAELRGVPLDALVAQLERNADEVVP